MSNRMVPRSHASRNSQIASLIHQHHEMNVYHDEGNIMIICYQY